MTAATRVWDVLTAISLALITALYLAGTRRLWKSAGGRQSLRPWQAASFIAGCASAAVALLSPLERWSGILFSAHMAQHEMLMLVAAPLMVLGRPFVAAIWALSPARRADVARAVRNPALGAAWERISGPLTVLIVHALVLWAWHVPVLFEAALHDKSIHVFQHLGFFLTSALFWWALIHGRYGRLGYGVGVVYVFATAMHTEVLGALLTFGSRIWYPTHAARTAAAGINPVHDQQLAGILMWIPFGGVFALVGLALFAAWLGEAERRVAFTTSDRAVREGRA